MEIKIRYARHAAYAKDTTPLTQAGGERREENREPFVIAVHLERTRISVLVPASVAFDARESKEISRISKTETARVILILHARTFMHAQLKY